MFSKMKYELIKTNQGKSSFQQNVDCAKLKLFTICVKINWALAGQSGQNVTSLKTTEKAQKVPHRR